MFPGRTYLQDPEWGNWMILVEFFCVGLAAGTYFAYWLLDVFGGLGDKSTARRLGFLPLPLLSIAGLLIIADLGQPLRALNMFFTHADAVEQRGGPIFFNAASTMNWGSYVYLLFGLFTLVAFLDSLMHYGRFPRMSLGERTAHNMIWGGVGSFLGLLAAGYPGVLLTVTQQTVWTDSLFVGALYIASGLFAGVGVAAVLAHWRNVPSTAEGVRGVLLWFAIANAVLVVVFVALLGPFARALLLGVSALVAVVFWIGVIVAGVLLPLWMLWGRPVGPLRPLGWPARRTIATAGALAIVGALAIRYSVLFSTAAALHG